MQRFCITFIGAKVPAGNTYQIFVKKTATKTSRMLKRRVDSLPVGGAMKVVGKTSSSYRKSFNFSILSKAQQMDERNLAYKFFSID